MAEYIEREELARFLRDEIVECETALNNMETPYEHQLEEEAVSGRMQAMVDVWRKVINKAPADVVEVVRCKDCEHFKSIDYNLNKCEEHSDGWGDYTVYVGEDDYCSFGIRKEGAEE